MLARVLPAARRRQEDVRGTIALPRGKAYPYSSARQAERPLRQSLRRMQRLLGRARKTDIIRRGLIEERLVKVAERVKTMSGLA